jgi:hypothetical protein
MVSFPDPTDNRAGIGIKGSDADCPTHTVAVSTAVRTKRTLGHTVLQPWI